MHKMLSDGFTATREVDIDRRRLFTGAMSVPLLLSGYIPSERALAQVQDKFSIRQALVNPMDVWLYTIHMPPEFPSTWLFGGRENPPIPADFFDIGSDPWVGEVSCVGIPLEPNGHSPTSDLVVRHDAAEWIANPTRLYGPREVPKNLRLRCDMKRLNERGVEPITVTYGGKRPEEMWSVYVGMAKDHPGGGYIDITWINPNGNGGLCDIEIAVKVEFKFTRLPASGTPKEVVLKSDVEWLSETNHNFTRWADAAASRTFSISPGAHANFIPASRDLGGEMKAAAGKSCNSRVSHSFILAPKNAPQSWGRPEMIKQFSARREKI
ncbi:hypothetical protein [Pseudomonas sp. P5_A2_2]